MLLFMSFENVKPIFGLECAADVCMFLFHFCRLVREGVFVHVYYVGIFAAKVHVMVCVCVWMSVCNCAYSIYTYIYIYMQCGILIFSWSVIKKQRKHLSSQTANMCVDGVHVRKHAVLSKWEKERKKNGKKEMLFNGWNNSNINRKKKCCNENIKDNEEKKQQKFGGICTGPGTATSRHWRGRKVSKPAAPVLPFNRFSTLCGIVIPLGHSKTELHSLSFSIFFFTSVSTLPRFPFRVYAIHCFLLLLLLLLFFFHIVMHFCLFFNNNCHFHAVFHFIARKQICIATAS